MYNTFQRMLLIALVWSGFAVNGVGAVTVYFRDGTRLEVEKVVRMGDAVALFVDISRIDTARTPIEETSPDGMMRDAGLKAENSAANALAITNLRFEPSDDNLDIIATGTIENRTQRRVGNIHITVTLLDGDDRVLLTIHGYPYPDVLEDGQTGTYAFRARKPQDFRKATVDVEAETR